MAKAFIQQKDGTVADGGSLAFNSNVGSGTLLVACVLLTGNGNQVNGITDSLGNTWARAVKIEGTTSGAGNNFNAAIWYASCPTGGACTITGDWAAAANAQVVLAEFSGFANGVTLDQTNSAENDNIATCSHGSITTTMAEAVAVACMVLSSSFTVSSRASGWNGLTAGSRRDSSYKILSSTETTDGAVTFGTAEDATGCIASFYETAGGGGGFTGAGRIFGGLSSPLLGLVVR